MTASGVHHRLDREGHPRLQFQARVGAPVVEDLRIFVELPAYPVATVLAHDRAVLRFDIGLN